MAVIMGSILAALYTLAPILHAQSWLGTAPTQSSLYGKVVVVDIFTFDCINCKHVVPELRRLRSAISTSDLAIVGVHSPETPYERDRANVVANLAKQGIAWPVAIDNDFAIWKAYDNQYWPAQLIFDRHGKLRQSVIGEGQDALVDRTVRELVAER